MANFVCSLRRAARFLLCPSVALVATCGFVATASAQTTVTLSTPGTHINADLYVQGGTAASTDFSRAAVLASKVSSEAYTRRIFLKFDTQNHIPANTVITSAYLYLTLNKAENSENRPFTAYHVNKSFVRWETTWKTFRSGQYWSRTGGDLGSSFGTTYVGAAVGTPYRFDLTKLVQAAVNGQFGSRYTRVALIDTGAATNGNYREFHSTRSSNTAARPRLVVTYGAATSTTSPSPTPAPTDSTTSPTTTAPTSTATIRVMQFNIHKTKDSRGVCNPDLIASTIATQKPDVVSLNEVNFFSGACAWSFDMGAKLESLVEQKTGVAWYRQHVNGADGVGNVLLSRYAPLSKGSIALSYGRGVAQMSIMVNGRIINLFSTHVEYYNSSWRPIQIKEALRWMSGFSEPRIMMGDFNTWPNTADYSLMAVPYQDAWVAAQKAGTAWAFNGTGVTKGTSRFDYIFHSRVAALSLQSVKVPDTRVNGIWPSDHHPVIAVFRVN